MDFYVAGCAPHITSGTSTMRIQGSHDYIFNTRENQKPLMTWGYSQAFYDTPIHDNELIVQIASVIAAGAKGIQLFQLNANQQFTNSDTWNACVNIMHTIGYLQTQIRIGDIEGILLCFL